MDSNLARGHISKLLLEVAIDLGLNLIVNLAPVDFGVVRRYKTSQISQRVIHKSSKNLQNITRVSLLYVEKLE